MKATASNGALSSFAAGWRQRRSQWKVEWHRLKHHCRMLGAWWLQAHEPFQPLFVVATCRTGSNLLLDYLRQQPGVQMLPEILWWGAQYGPRSSTLPPQRAARHIAYSLQTMRSPIRGCKLMLYQLDNYGLTLNHLNASFPDAKYIVLYRESLAEQFISQEIAYATRQWALRPGDKRREVTVTVSADKLREYCETIRQGYRDVLAHRWLSARGVLLSYEELTRDAAACLRERIAPLLDIDAVKPETRMFKQNPRTLAESVANYDEVATLLNSPLCRQKYAWPSRPQPRRQAPRLQLALPKQAA